MEDDELGIQLGSDGEFQDENCKFYQLRKQFLHTIEQSDNLNNEKEKLKTIIDNFMEESDELKTDWHSARAESGKKKRLLKKLEERLEEARREKDLQVNENENLSKSISELNQDLLGFIDEVNKFGESSESSDSVEVNGEILKTLKASVFRRFKDYQKKIAELKKNQEASNIRLESASSRFPEALPGPPAFTVVAPHSSSSSQEIPTEEYKPVLHPPDPHMADPYKRLTCVCTLQFRSYRDLSIHLAKDGAAEWKFQCKHCPHRFYLFKRLKEHHTTVHSNLPGLKAVNGCSLCGTSYERRAEYMEHQRATHNLQASHKARPLVKTVLRGNQRRKTHTEGRIYACIDLTIDDYTENTVPTHLPPPHVSTLTPTSNGVTVVTLRPEHSRLEQSNTATATSTHRRNETSQQPQCILGPQKFSKPSQLKDHNKMNTGRKLFDCNICNKMYRMLSQLRVHLKSKHGVKKDKLPPLFGCTTCGKMFPTRSKLMLHRNERHPHSKINQKMKRHKRNWSKRKLGYYCTCGTKTSSRQLFNNHIDTFMGEGSSTPMHRPAEEPQQESSTNHRYSSGVPTALRNSRGRSGSPSSGNSTTLDRPDQGPEPVASTSRGHSIVIPTRPCNIPERSPISQTFVDLPKPDVKVVAHLTFEPTTGNSHEVDTESQGFFCKCGVNFGNEDLLLKHITYLSKLMKFTCQTCKQKFTTPTSLKIHMLQRHRILLKEKKKCLTCGETFTTTMELYAHRRSVHSVRAAPVDIKFQPVLNDEPPPDAEHSITSGEPGQQYKCKCGKTSNTKGNLLTHVRSKLKLQIFSCHLCSVKTANHYALKDHVKKIHEIPYERGKIGCHQCGSTFHTRKELGKHLRTHRSQLGK